MEISLEDLPEFRNVKLTGKQIMRNMLQTGYIEKVSPTRVRLTELGEDTLKMMNGTDEVDVKDSMDIDDYIQFIENDDE